MRTPHHPLLWLRDVPGRTHLALTERHGYDKMQFLLPWLTRLSLGKKA